MNAAIDGQRLAEGARLRAEAWGLLAAALEYPDEELIALVREGALMRRARELIGTLDQAWTRRSRGPRWPRCRPPTGWRSNTRGCSTRSAPAVPPARCTAACCSARTGA